MQARLTTKPEHEVIAAIQALDLESVKLRVMDQERGEGWTRDHTDGIETAYKNFLSMLVKYPDDADDILLSEDVDEFWHAHILQTMKYADDCQRVFGNFLHHNPQIGKGTQAEAERRAAQVEKTRRLYLQEFGDTRVADSAWTGRIVGAHEKIAYCEAAIRSNGPAYCEATIRAGKTAYCEAAARSKPAYCEAAVHANKAAYCEAAVRADKAAYCEATVQSKPAYCEATVRAGKTAYCEAAARSKPAYCEAAVHANKAAYCEATARADKAAYCEATAQARNAG